MPSSAYTFMIPEFLYLFHFSVLIGTTVFVWTFTWHQHWLPVKENYFLRHTEPGCWFTSDCLVGTHTVNNSM